MRPAFDFPGMIPTRLRHSDLLAIRIGASSDQDERVRYLVKDAKPSEPLFF